VHLFKNDSSLIKKAGAGHRGAQKQLYEKYAPKMLSVCRQYIKDLQHAEDAMLNGFMKVFKHLEDFNNSGSFEGWIRKIMVRESISFLRQYKELHFKENDDLEHDVESTIPLEMEVADIQSLIDELPAGYKAVFVLYAVEGYKHLEIAGMLDISVGTSKSQLFKARRMLQHKLETNYTSSYGAN